MAELAFCSITPVPILDLEPISPPLCVHRPTGGCRSAGATSVQCCHFLHWRRLTPDFLQKCSFVVMQLMCFDFRPIAVLSLTRVGDFQIPVSLKCASLTAWEEAGVPQCECTNSALKRPPGTNCESILLRGNSANRCSTVLPM